jgi:hypothetical protein
MNSTLKLYAGLGLFAVVIFGATIVSQFSGAARKTNPDDGPDLPADFGPPLQFQTTQMMYEPGSEVLSRRTFTGFYEPGEQLHAANFWFTNRHPKPVNVAVLARSCSACTSARIGVLPASEVNKLFGAGAAWSFAAGVVPDLATAATAAGMLAGLKWEVLDFDKPNELHEVPPAAADGTPTVGAFQMLFKVTAQGPKTLDVRLGMALKDQPGLGMPFSVSFMGMPPFEVRPTPVALGNLPEGMSPKSFEMICWSSTRQTSGDGLPFPPPTVVVGPNDKFLQAGPPAPLNDNELQALVQQLTVEGRSPRVLGAYRVPMTVYRRLPADQITPGKSPEPDIGPFDRQVRFFVPGSPDPVLVPVSGTVTGLVTIVGGGAVDLGSFRSQSGVKKTAELATDRDGLGLEVLAAEVNPKFLTATLSDRGGSGGRKLWGLSVEVPPGACIADLPNDSAVVLKATVDGETRRVKIPVKGRGFATVAR